jgi:hypothetical protein
MNGKKVEYVVIEENSANVVLKNNSNYVLKGNFAESDFLMKSLKLPKDVAHEYYSSNTSERNMRARNEELQHLRKPILNENSNNIPQRGNSAPLSAKENYELARLEAKREYHIKCEKQRRDDIKKAFQKLADELPSTDLNMSKVMILRKTLDFVKEIKQEVESLTEEVERLKNLNVVSNINI